MNSTSHNQTATEHENTPLMGEKVHIFPTLVDLAAIFGVFIIAQIASVMLVKISLPHLITPNSDSFIDALTLLVAQIISMVVTIYFTMFMRRRSKSAKQRISFSLRGFNPTILLGGVLMLLSMGVIIEPLLSLLPPPPAISQRGWPTLVAVVIAAPLFEEILCRGMLFESMRTKWGLIGAWLGSSLFFALMHLSPVMIINAFFMGLILCYIYIYSRSLIASMILHAINNAIAYSLIVLGFAGDDGNVMLRDLISSDSIYWIVYIIAAIILVGSTILCIRQFRVIMKSSKMVAAQDSDTIETGAKSASEEDKE